jgi:hypothetical protein
MNPKYVASFLDESINKQLACVCRVAHRRVWHDRLFALFGQAEERRIKRARR